MTKPRVARATTQRRNLVTDDREAVVLCERCGVRFGHRPDSPQARRECESLAQIHNTKNHRVG